MKVPHADPLNITQSSNRPAGFEVNRLPSGGFALKLWGRFHSNWISSLSSGLSGNQWQRKKGKKPMAGRVRDHSNSIVHKFEQN